MNPENSRTSAIIASREQLARAMMRFDELAHRAIESVAALTREKRELEQRVAELTELLTQERTNSKQREKLFSSDREESDLRRAELIELKSKREDQESLLREQLEIISKLEDELVNTARLLEERNSTEEVRLSQISNTESTLQSLEEKLLDVTRERDELKSRLYAKEREAAGWALKLSREDAKAAVKALETISKKLETLEVHSQEIPSEESEPVHAQPDIFQAA